MNQIARPECREALAPTGLRQARPERSLLAVLVSIRSLARCRPRPQTREHGQQAAPIRRRGSIDRHDAGEFLLFERFARAKLRFQHRDVGLGGVRARLGPLAHASAQGLDRRIEGEDREGRAERRCQHLNAVEPLRGECLAYLNRLSDLLFVGARLIARRQQVDEVLWQAAERDA